VTDLEIRLATALAIIEGIALQQADDSGHLGTIYRLAHEGLGVCSACSPGFKDHVNSLKARLKEDGVMDVDRAMDEMVRKWELGMPKEERKGPLASKLWHAK